MDSISQDPIIDDCTQSELGFLHSDQTYFGHLQINLLNRSNFLDQMTSNERNYFSTFQDDILAQIRAIRLEYHKNKSNNRPILWKSETSGAESSSNLYDFANLGPTSKSKMYVNYRIFV